MEAKLREYRALRRRKELINNAKEKLEESRQKIANLLVPKFLTEMGKEKDEEVLLMNNEETEVKEIQQPTKSQLPIKHQPPKKQLPPEPESPSEVASEVSELESFVEEPNPESWKYFTTKWIIYALVWMTLFAIFLKLQFGAVFFVISVLIGICLNTHTRPRKQGEVSAYSVFNENCVSIDGTLKAEQFEREIRYGAGSVR